MRARETLPRNAVGFEADPPRRISVAGQSAAIANRTDLFGILVHYRGAPTYRGGNLQQSRPAGRQPEAAHDSQFQGHTPRYGGNSLG